MIPHPSVWFDNPPPVPERQGTMWKKILGWLGKFFVAYGPGVVEAVMEAKAKKEAQKPPSQ